MHDRRQLMSAGVLSALAIGGGCAFAQDPAEAKVDAIIEPMIARGAPGVAVLVARDGKAALRKGYGFANIETKEPIRADTVFDLASVSKQFTAMAILMLRDQGKLGLDDPLTRFVPEFPAYGQRITVRHLLTHTGGLPDYMQRLYLTGAVRWTGRPGGPEPSSADVLKLLTQPRRPAFEAGERWEYSNSGYVVLGQIAEKASGWRLPTYLRETIFQPLGMTSTVMFDETRPPIPRRAISYNPTRNGGFENADYHPLNLIYGDGGVNSSIDDMLLWDQALYGEELVKAASLSEAFTSGRLNNGAATGYGFGWQIGQWGGLPTVGHGGDWAGFRTHILRFPAQRVTVVVLSNNGSFNHGLAACRIAGVYLDGRRPAPPDVDRAVLETYVGRYRLAGLVLTVTLENGVLHLQPSGQRKGALAPISQADFYIVKNEDISVTFNADHQGEVPTLTLHQNGDHVGTRIGR